MAEYVWVDANGETRSKSRVSLSPSDPSQSMTTILRLPYLWPTPACNFACTRHKCPCGLPGPDLFRQHLGHATPFLSGRRRGILALRVAVSGSHEAETGGALLTLESELSHTPGAAAKQATLRPSATLRIRKPPRISVTPRWSPLAPAERTNRCPGFGGPRCRVRRRVDCPSPCVIPYDVQHIADRIKSYRVQSRRS